MSDESFVLERPLRAQVEPATFDIQLDGVWLEVSAHVETPTKWVGFDAGSPGSAEITRVTAGGMVCIQDLLTDRQIDRIESAVIDAAKKREDRLGAETSPARKLARAALMLAESVLSPDAADHKVSIAIQAEAVRKLYREVIA